MKFDEAVNSLPKGTAKGRSAAQGLAYCQKLFDFDEQFAHPSPEEQYHKRLEQEKLFWLLCCHGQIPEQPRHSLLWEKRLPT